MGSQFSPVDSDSTVSRWHDLEDLLDELARASKADLTAEAFYRTLLARIVPALDARGGAIWIARGSSQLRLEAQLSLTNGSGDAAALEPHRALVEDVLRTGEPCAVDPDTVAGATGSEGVMPAGWWVFHPFAAADARGVIELVGPKDMTAAGSRHYVGILAAVVELADDFHRHGELRRLRAAAAAWREYDAFARRVHQSLNVEQTAFLIANDGCRLVECDRASVLVRHGSAFRAEAASGVDAIERRSKIVRLLEQLAARSAASGEPVWYDERSADVPDEIAHPLERYLDESHARALAIVPLCDARAEAADPNKQVIGVFVAEQFEAAQAPELMRERVTAVSEHAAVALGNALAHSRMPLARVGRMLAGVRWLTEARQLPKTLLAVAAAAAVVAILAFVPADFDVRAEGTFQPARRREVFASDDGVVRELSVEAGGTVTADQPLVVLRNQELDQEARRLAGEVQTAAKKLAAVEAERLAGARRGQDERRDARELAGEEAELRSVLAGLQAQQAIVKQRQDGLTIRSPIAGEVLSWNVEQSLAARPVERGQVLLSVGDLAGPWVLELSVPDDRAGAVLRARDASEAELEVSFVLASDPGTVHRGRVSEVALATELDEQDEPMMRATVEFDQDGVSGLRPGATAQAKIHCGRRSLGYVWLADLYHYLQSLWW